jgi:hypothetical protein
MIPPFYRNQWGFKKIARPDGDDSTLDTFGAVNDSGSGGQDFYRNVGPKKSFSASRRSGVS